MLKSNKLSPEEYEKNFEELVPPFSENSAAAEANRCLFCYDSPCTKACPTHIDIPTFIKKISTGNILGSAKTILTSNWIALTCAKACPVSILCEGACVFIEKGEKPIEIGRLQRFAIDNYFQNDMPKLFEKKASIGKSVGIIGSGPAGLACGAELALLGVDAVIYEANEIPGGLDTWGIAPYKTKREDSLKEVEMVKSFGVKIVTGKKIGADILIDNLLTKHDALFIGIGLGESGKLNIPGENLNGVFEAIKFIEEVKKEKWDSVNIGERVAVIGAGNTAIDAATEAKRLGANEVMIIYRRTENEMPANDYEYQLAKNDGIIFKFLTSPVEIIGNDFVEGIKCSKMELKNLGNTGRGRPAAIPGSDFVIPVDMIISALGQTGNDSFLDSITGLKINNDRIEVDPVSYQTGNLKVFAGGDCINGGKEVVNAAYEGKNAAHGIYNYLVKN
jgi:glutamate synthase (NADPH/NADH) small chain